MRVRDVMNTKLVTIDEETSIHDARKIMEDKKIRRLLIVKNDKLVGLVTERMLLEAAPSKATTLSIHELHYLLAKMVVKDIMVKKPMSISSNMPIEEALHLGQENGYGAFPVVDDGKLVGITTESDIVRIMTKILGVKDKGVRIDIEVTKDYGNLQGIMKVLDDMQIPLLSLMVFNCPEDGAGECRIFIRLVRGDSAEIAKKLTAAGFKVTDAGY